jgi:beige protein homolog 1
MSTPQRRHRSSTAASTSSNAAVIATELGPLIELLSVHSKVGPHPGSSRDLQTELQNLHRIRQFLIESTDQPHAKDAFRNLWGFQALLSILKSVSGLYNPNKLSKTDVAELFELLRVVLGVLGEALKDHWGNRRYFTRRVEGGGWEALESALASTGLVGWTPDTGDVDEAGQEQLFGCLFAFAMGEETIVHMFAALRRRFAASGQDGDNNKSANKLDLGKGQDVVPAIKAMMNDYIGPHDLLSNPEIIPTIFKFWCSLRWQGDDKVGVSKITSLSVLLAIENISASSKYNLVSVQTSGILGMALPHLFFTKMSQEETKILQTLCDDLATLGVSQLKDGQFLFRKAIDNPQVAAFLLRAVKSSRGPPHFQFDLSIHGFSSIELPTLGAPFPPSSGSAGYTFTAWICIDKFDANMHTTIFGAFDASQTCFILGYIEKDTKKFILQTSVTSSKASIRFKSMTFQEHRWYHLSLVHRRPRTVTSSRASLYIDGEFVEEVKVQYPSSPPLSNGSTDSFASLSSSSGKRNAVQVFLGTPADLSPRLGKGISSSCWSLASAHLIDEVLSDDLIAVYYRLGPRYNGNFQDCLGSFQTYEASAGLNMRNEISHPGKEEKSDILLAIRQKAGALLPEARVLLSISPAAVLDDDDRNNIDETQLIKSLSRGAAKSLQQLTRSGGNAIAVNGATPSINDALTQTRGVAILTGDPIVFVPQSLDDAAWRVAGCAAVGLKMIESAITRESVVQAVEILFEIVKGSWRNSEAMERESGFTILASLLRSKMGAGALGVPGSSSITGAIHGDADEREKLSLQLLSLVLDFVGYQHDKPEESIISNPLAYRILLVDFDMWRKVAHRTQTLYYRQFLVFGEESKYHLFNSKRLFRMRESDKCCHFVNYTDIVMQVS